MTTATQVRERPILFSGPMVKAILRGHKTQTRRVIDCSCNSPHSGRLIGDMGMSCPPFQLSQGDLDEGVWRWRWKGQRDPVVGDWIEEVQTDVDDTMHFPVRCPYGQVGDRLWVRETWARSRNNWLYRADSGEGVQPSECVDDWDWDSTCVDKWRPSIHMPRRAARLFLDVTGVRVERLNDITAEDAIAEGVAEFASQHRLTGYWTTAFARLWDSINGPESWQANPWVWVVKFRRVKGHGS